MVLKGKEGLYHAQPGKGTFARKKEGIALTLILLPAPDTGRHCCMYQC